MTGAVGGAERTGWILFWWYGFHVVLRTKVDVVEKSSLKTLHAELVTHAFDDVSKLTYLVQGWELKKKKIQLTSFAKVALEKKFCVKSSSGLAKR